MTKQTKLLDSTTEKDAQPVKKMLFNMLYLCGCPNVASVQTGFRIHLVVSTILKTWMQLRTAIHEGVTITDMEVFSANPNDILYQGKVKNDMIYADAKDVQRPHLGREAGRILCTVGMGLKRSVIKQNGHGVTSIQSDTI